MTKFHPASLVRELYALGVRDVGENRQQEAAARRPRNSADLDLRWHFIGQLQTNKARAGAARTPTSSTRSTASASSTRWRRRRRGRALDVLLQVNLTDDPGRGGVAAGELDRLAGRVIAAPRALRCAASWPSRRSTREPAAGVRAAARRYRERVRRGRAGRDWISAGMSGDFAEAIAEGATHLRIGTAITGNRPQPRLISETDVRSPQEEDNGEPAAQDHGVPRPRRRGLDYEEPAPQPAAGAQRTERRRRQRAAARR